MSFDSSYIVVAQATPAQLKIYQRSGNNFSLFQTISLGFSASNLMITNTHLLVSGLTTNIFIYENSGGAYTQTH